MDTENVIQSNFIKLVNANGGYASNIHGNMFTCGVPDLLITSKHGVSFSCELKVWRNVGPPKDVDALFRMLRKTQKPFIKNVWKRNGFCPIAAFQPNKEGMVFVTNGNKVWATYPPPLMKMLIELRFEDLTSDAFQNLPL